jgi:hypothetical protein
MLYALLIHRPPDFAKDRTPQEEERMLADHRALQVHTKRDASFRSAIQLHDASATTLRRRKAKMIITDGPFAETKELLIGLYLVECPNLDVALELAARIPDVDGGSVEIRPVVYAESQEFPSL